MRYCSVSDVKGWLNMTPTEIQYDTEIQQIILNVESQMDEQLRAYTTTPLQKVPDEIRWIAAEWAAGVFRLKRANLDESKSQPLVSEAKERLKDFIRSNYLSGKAASTGVVKG
ncbi:MAG: hypothetical protein QXN08_01170 [Nitrososphaerales archaeon]